MDIEVFGWIGAICLAICGLPQAIQAIKHKHANGVTWGLISLWGFGDLFQLIYVTYKQDWPIVVNCFFNLVIILVIAYYKQFPKSFKV